MCPIRLAGGTIPCRLFVLHGFCIRPAPDEGLMSRVSDALLRTTRSVSYLWMDCQAPVLRPILRIHIQPMTPVAVEASDNSETMRTATSIQKRIGNRRIRVSE